MTLTSNEYRLTRAEIRNTSSRALDALDAVHRALSYGDTREAWKAARALGMTADDLTALLERIVRLVGSMTNGTERYAPGVE